MKQGTRIAVPQLGDAARRRRTLDQRLGARVPAVYRVVGEVVRQLPTGSTMRQRAVARQIALAYAAANRRDFGAVLIGLDAERFEYLPSRDLLPPDMAGVFRGHAGYLDVWRHWLEAFGDIRWDPEEILDFGDAFIVTTQQRGTGSGSGVGVSQPVYQVFTMRGALAVRQEDFLAWDEALEAAMRAAP